MNIFLEPSSDAGKVEKVESDNKEEADTFRSRFASNMADYFKDNPDAFNFEEGSVGDRVC